jgi:hypothetical protein
MTATEQEDAHFVANALPGLEEQTGFPRSRLHLSIVHTEAQGGWDFVIARPHLARLTVRLGEVALPQPNPDTWWVYDADVDESECWISQATFLPTGYINHGDDPRFEAFDAIMGARAVDEPEDPDEDEPDALWDERIEIRSGDEDSPPRNPHAPVTMSIDLDEADQAKREGLPAWEEHERFGVLVNEKGFAVVFDDPTGPAVGIVRYPDKTACSIKEPTPSKAREMAEKFLANRPYRTAMERVLGEAEFDAEEPAPPPLVDEPATSPAVPRPTPPKRQWGTVSINSVDDEDD